MGDIDSDEQEGERYQRGGEFTISSPGSSRAVRKEEKVKKEKKVDEKDLGLEGEGSKKTSSSDQMQQLASPTAASVEGEKNEDKSENSPDLTFKKKDITKPRTQSCQSVLSTASLRSLMQQQQQQQQQQQTQQQHQQYQQNLGGISGNGTKSNRDGNSVSNNGSNVNTYKNFQSFIQAPVLSSITSFNTHEADTEIGQQLPFHGDRRDGQGEDGKSCGNNEGAAAAHSKDTIEDQEILIQQQKLTLNALKKLSLSPMPIINPEEDLHRKSTLPAKEVPPAKPREKSSGTESYQPAQVDLSSFASLTRQSKVNQAGKPRNMVDEVSSNQASSTPNTTMQSGEDGKLAESGFSKDTRVTTGATNPLKLLKESAESLEKRNDANGWSQKEDGVKPIESNGFFAAKVDTAIDNKTMGAHPAPSLTTLPTRAAQKYHQDIHQNHLKRAGNTMVQLPTPRSNMNNIDSTENNRNVPPGNLIHERHQQHRAQSHKTNQPLKQIKGMRSPMYIPAVLRMTSPSIGSNSVPSNDSPFATNIDDHDAPGALAKDFKNSWPHEESRSASRISVDSFESCKTNSSDSHPISPLMPPSNWPLLASQKKYDSILKQTPTRKHWVKNEAVYKCGMPTCPKVFNFFERRHHCRKCGGIFCREHTSHYLYINHLAQFTTGGRGTLSKVCNNCIEEYNKFMKYQFGVDIYSSSSTPFTDEVHADDDIQQLPSSRTYDRASTQSPKHHSPVPPQNESSDKLGDLEGYALKNGSNPTAMNSSGHRQSADSKAGQSDTVVGSVPANWSWSSF